ncbi:hypothetical protein, partial [Massilia sp. BJB1822]|uniref:hypothetical protein n=1 Tax=Massilia sp. BJB1822 TaxID=2744470 RepID=UPI0015936412
MTKKVEGDLEQLKRAALLKLLRQQQGILPPMRERSILGKADRSGALPLSWSQQRLWFLAQLDAAAGQAYH